jgi:urease accessory protein
VHAYTDQLTELDELFHAMLLPREARQASSAIGASLLRSVCDIAADARLTEFASTGPHRHAPIAFGAVAAAFDVPAELAASTYALQNVRSLVSAAQRLGRVGQRDAQRVLHRVKPAMRMAVATAQQLTPDSAGAFSPVWDIASMRHEHAPVRMFAS